MDEVARDARLAELTKRERALWPRVEAGDADATEQCAALLGERDILLNPGTERGGVVNDEERDRHRRDLQQAYAQIETVLLAQRQTPDILRQLAETRRLRDNLGVAEVDSKGVSEDWRQDMLAQVDELERKARVGAAGLDGVGLLSKIEMVRLEVLAARGADEPDKGPR